ncbi:MAG: hypothetical protein JJU34_10660 [Lunatimonas sp.]|uniref:hypothetical protein n=1 Tax=Lunatimonas sp. TaxID=2060141 RepID=UPI00263B7249|nr:hypothetical protein [Lunatimonas sp.]MCC5937732.1 hypothetical protein [Lunatimonas sp.]
MHSYKTLLIQLVVVTLLVSLAIVALQWLAPGPWIHRQIWAITFFFAILTAITGMFSIHLLKNDKLNSVSIILGSTVFRLIVSLLFVFVLLWGEDENLLWFVVNFFIIYLLYLLFDIYSLITNLRLHLK